MNMDFRKVLSRFISILIIAVIGGYAMHQSNLDDWKKGQEMTLEKYTAGYDAYKTKLEDDTNSLSFDLFIMLLLMAGLVGIYELVNIIVAQILMAILPAPQPSRSFDDERKQFPGNEHFR